jgi:hypothetical protein
MVIDTSSFGRAIASARTELELSQLGNRRKNHESSVFLVCQTDLPALQMGQNGAKVSVSNIL